MELIPLGAIRTESAVEGKSDLVVGMLILSKPVISGYKSWLRESAQKHGLTQIDDYPFLHRTERAMTTGSWRRKDGYKEFRQRLESLFPLSMARPS